MKATAIRRYRCVCTECEPSPPVEGLHPLTFEAAEEMPRKTRGLLGIIAEWVAPRRPD
jgi:hypothetical protein